MDWWLQWSLFSSNYKVKSDRDARRTKKMKTDPNLLVEVERNAPGF